MAKRGSKNKDAPKRPITAYFFYLKERRESLKKEKPSLDNKEILKAIGVEWNELSKEKKKKYETMANEDKKRYEKEKNEYNKSKEKNKKKEESEEEE